MRIAWIAYDFEEYSCAHVNEMAEEHDVLLVMPEADDSSQAYSIADSVQQYAFAKPRLRQPLRQIQSVRQILNRVHQFLPDVVHYQQGHLWFNTALRSLKKYPLVITIHDPRHHAGDVVSQKTPQWMMDYGFRQADHVIVHGTALVDEVTNHFSIPRQNIHVIPHIAMGDTVTPPSPETESNNVLFFGRIWAYKGLEFLIQAEPMIREHVPDIKIVIGGEGDDFDRYRKLIERPESFEIHNRWISDEERSEMFQRAAVVVLPYTEATQSGVVPVAYNFAKPVIATRVGALAECVEDNETGLLVAPRDPQKLADAVVKLLTDSELRNRMGAAGKAKLDSDCAPHFVAAQTIHVYQQAVENSTTNRHREVVAS